MPGNFPEYTWFTGIYRLGLLGLIGTAQGSPGGSLELALKANWFRISRGIIF
jgi:hypothetical protein